MKKSVVVILMVSALFVALSIGQAVADVNINIGINAPLPRLVLPAPPAVILIPGAYAYFVPDIDVDLIFFQGYWYRPHRGAWHRAGEYNGPWIYIEIGKVPGVLVNLPPDFRRVPPGHQRIPYGQMKKNWKNWEKEKHWDRHEVKGRHKEQKKGRGKGKKDD